MMHHIDWNKLQFAKTRIFPNDKKALDEILQSKKNDDALMIIDVQKYLRLESYFEPDKFKNIKALCENADAQNIPVIFIEYCPAGRIKSTDEKLTEVVKNPIHMTKLVMNGFENKYLLPVLEKLGTKKITMAGFNALACVYTTAMHARDLGFKIDTAKDVLLGINTSYMGLNAEKILKNYALKTNLTETYKQLPIFKNNGEKCTAK